MINDQQLENKIRQNPVKETKEINTLVEVGISQLKRFSPLVMNTILSVFLGMIGFYTLTEEDRLEAGIYIDKRGK